MGLRMGGQVVLPIQSVQREQIDEWLDKESGSRDETSMDKFLKDECMEERDDWKKAEIMDRETDR